MSDRRNGPIGIPRKVWDIWQRNNPAAGSPLNQQPNRLLLSAAQSQLVATALVFAMTDSHCSERDQHEASQVLEQMGYKQAAIKAMVNELKAQ